MTIRIRHISNIHEHHTIHCNLRLPAFGKVDLNLDVFQVGGGGGSDVGYLTVLAVGFLRAYHVNIHHNICLSLLSISLLVSITFELVKNQTNRQIIISLKSLI